jgi:hypothetical protein
VIAKQLRWQLAPRATEKKSTNARRKKRATYLAIGIGPSNPCLCRRHIIPLFSNAIIRLGNLEARKLNARRDATRIYEEY